MQLKTGMHLALAYTQNISCWANSSSNFIVRAEYEYPYTLNFNFQNMGQHIFSLFSNVPGLLSPSLALPPLLEASIPGAHARKMKRKSKAMEPWDKLWRETELWQGTCSSLFHIASNVDRVEMTTSSEYRRSISKDMLKRIPVIRFHQKYNIPDGRPRYSRVERAKPTTRNQGYKS